MGQETGLLENSYKLANLFLLFSSGWDLFSLPLAFLPTNGGLCLLNRTLEIVYLKILQKERRKFIYLSCLCRILGNRYV